MERREWFITLDLRARIAVVASGRPMTGYVVRLELHVDDDWITVHLFDNAHGRHDEHAYAGDAKQPASDFFYGPPTQALPAAIGLIESDGLRSSKSGRKAGMSKSADDISTAANATSKRFLRTVMGEDDRYPNGSEFVASDMPRLDDIISRKIREGRATVIVHDDGSDIVIEPRPEMPLLTLAGVLLLGALLRHVKPTIEAGGEVIRLPAATRVSLHPPGALAA